MAISGGISVSPAQALEGDYPWLNRQLSWGDGSSSPLSMGTLYQIEDRGNGVAVGHPCFQIHPNSRVCEDLLKGSYDYSTAMNMCTEGYKFACITRVQLQNEAGESVDGINLGPWISQVGGAEFPIEFSSRLPTRNTSNLFSFDMGEGVVQTLDVTPQLRYRIIDGNLQEDYFQLDAKPIELRTDIAKPDIWSASGPCLESHSTEGCYAAYNLPSGYKLLFTARFERAPQGWLNGRTLQPDIKLSKKGDFQEVQLTAGFLEVPFVLRDYRFNNLADRRMWNKLQSVFPNPWDQPCVRGESGPCSSGFDGVATSIDLYVRASKIDPALDRALSLTQKLSMSFGFEKQAFRVGNKNCTADGFLGYLGSNALTFDGTVPKFDNRTKTVRYKVASPHYMPDGQEFEGVFEMVLNRKFADCMWGTSASRVKATLSVLDDSKKTKVHTTILRQNSEFVKLSVYGFDFSTANFALKLQNDKKTKITCITTKKPTKTKTVTGFSPKCPTGYKKK